MYSEDNLLPLSALQHLLFCERQCALIHIEQQWDENVLTVEGKGMHKRSDQSQTESRGNIRLARGVWLKCLRLGLTGRADLVEFHRIDSPGEGVALANISGRWRPFPVEDKHGRPKKDLMDKVQLCGQALCLEEMLNVRIASGALFYGKTRHRLDVVFDDDLRSQTEKAARRLRQLLASGATPPAVYEKKCDSCSLYEQCRPKLLQQNNASVWLTRMIREAVV
ncbi:MAG: CRISPR-associated protein Cas4 [Kiritimatiellae bacterium]|nr:CRISPR-associated protein Cas4 [Kiritimatiellia bacterium]